MDEVDYGSFKIVSEVGADTTDFVSSFQSAIAVLTMFRGAAALASTAVGSLAGVAMLEAMRRAMEFETQMVKITTLTNETIGHIDELGDAVLSMAGDVGMAADDLARGLYQITSSGIVGADALELLEQAAKASLIGMGDIAEISRIAAAAMQAWGSDTLSATDAIEIMLEGVRQGSIEADEYGNSLARVIGIASQMGITFEEVNAFVATFSRLGAGADVATTALRAALSAILQPGAEARKVFEEIGIPIDEMRRKIREDGLTLAFIELMEAAQGNQDVIGDLLPNVRALSGVLGTAAAQAETYVQVAKEIEERNRGMNETFSEYEETTKAGLRELNAEMGAFLTKLGQVGLMIAGPLVKETNEWIDLLKESFRELALLKNMIEGDLDWGEGWAAMIGGDEDDPESRARLERAALARARMSPDQRNRADAESFVSGKSFEELNTLATTLREKLSGLAAQWRNTADPETLSRISAYNILLQETQEAIDKIIAQNPAVDGVGVILGPTSEQIEATEKLIARLRERLLMAQENERQLLLEELAAQNASEANKELALSYYDQAVAVEEAKKAKEELARRMKQVDEGTRREVERMREAGMREHMRMMREEQEIEMERIRIIGDVQMRAIERDIERMAEIAQAMSQSIVSSLMAMVDGTKKVGPAFADMVTRILMEVARLKLEEAIIGPLLRAMLPVPNAPAPVSVDIPNIAVPNIPNTWDAGTVPLGSAQIVVMPTINYSPSLIDARSGEQFINQHGNQIAGIAVQTMRSSIAVAREISRS